MDKLVKLYTRFFVENQKMPTAFIKENLKKYESPEDIEKPVTKYLRKVWTAYLKNFDSHYRKDFSTNDLTTYFSQAKKYVDDATSLDKAPKEDSNDRVCAMVQKNQMYKKYFFNSNKYFFCAKYQEDFYATDIKKLKSGLSHFLKLLS